MVEIHYLAERLNRFGDMGRTNEINSCTTSRVDIQRIKFNMKIEGDQQFSFLDIEVYKKEDNSLNHSIHIIKTYTNHCLNTKPHFPLQAIIKTLVMKILVRLNMENGNIKTQDKTWNGHHQ